MKEHDAGRNIMQKSRNSIICHLWCAASRGRNRLVAGLALLLAANIIGSAAGYAASLSVDVASPRGLSTGVGQGFLYGFTGDGSQPGNQFVSPLHINAFRSGGHVSGGWIADGFVFGSATQAEIKSVISTATRLRAAQYQVILSDMYGATGGQPTTTLFPCDNGDCSNWVNYLDAVLPRLQQTGLNFVYEVWNEPDISVFWPRGTNSVQYFQMWDTAVREIRRLAPNAVILGPTFAIGPLRNAAQWNTWLAHVKAADTVPNWITNHDEVDGDDPVTVAQALDSTLIANGIGVLPLSANEYGPQDRQFAGVTAWYLARFAQSSYTNALRGNWVCCLTPNMAGILTNDGLSPNGHWWVYRAYADMTGSLVNTSNAVGTTAISAAVDRAARRVVAIIGDSNGTTGTDEVTFSGLLSVLSLVNNGEVHVTVERIPEQSPLNAPLVVFSQDMTAGSGSVTIPVTFEDTHDAFAIYVTPGGLGGSNVTGPFVGTGSGRCLDVVGASAALGTPVDISDCTGMTNQQWHVTAAGELRVFNDTRCLDASGQRTADGTPLIIWSCNGQANQKWRFNSDGSITGVQSGRCLDVTAAATVNGTPIHLFDCNGQPNQQWTLQ
jgi:ricin-type beta-trefoil lectin protein